jgi:hypothetical protein
MQPDGSCDYPNAHEVTGDGIPDHLQNQPVGGPDSPGPSHTAEDESLICDFNNCNYGVPRDVEPLRADIFSDIYNALSDFLDDPQEQRCAAAVAIGIIVVIAGPETGWLGGMALALSATQIAYWCFG